MYKLLKDLPKVNISTTKEDLPVERVGICLWEPDETHKFVNMPPLECAVCGSDEFAEGKRLSAMLNPKFEFGFSYLMRILNVLKVVLKPTSLNRFPGNFIYYY